MNHGLTGLAGASDRVGSGTGGVSSAERSAGDFGGAWAVGASGRSGGGASGAGGGASVGGGAPSGGGAMVCGGRGASAGGGGASTGCGGGVCAPAGHA